MHDTPPIRVRLLLHAVLIACSLVFLLPYVWLVGTSWKLDKEIQQEDLNLLPDAPVARAKSPYIDDQTFPEIERPERVGRHRWDGWMRRVIDGEIEQAIKALSDPRGAEVEAAAMREEISQGVFQRLIAVLPAEAWEAEETAFRESVRASISSSMAQEAFEQAYRSLALAKVRLKDTRYGIHDLTGDRNPADVWRVSRGPASVVERREGGQPVAEVRYAFQGDGETFEIVGDFELPVSFTPPAKGGPGGVLGTGESDDKGTGSGHSDHDADVAGPANAAKHPPQPPLGRGGAGGAFKQLTVSYRRDLSWHALQAFVEIDDGLYKARTAQYLGEDTFTDLTLQLPSDDDQRMIPKHYTLLDKVDSGPQYDHGPRRLRLRLEVTRSTTPEAYYAKGTENYRKVFTEVPFWRYLATSGFLAIANIIGTCLSCSLAAYAFARLQWPGRGLCFILVLATLMIPPQVTMIPSFVIYKHLGWYNTLAPLWVPAWFGINAFAIFLLRQAMRGIPRDLEDAAKIDGCGYLRTYWHVALPLMKPALASISIFTFMYVWNDFLGPLIYVNDQRQYPLALGLFSFMAGRENQFALIMAGATVMTIPVVLMFFLMQRYFIQGVTMTGMKN